MKIVPGARGALYIDRDGVINRMIKYAHGWDCPQKPQDVQLVKGIEKVISWANKQNIPVVEISNQPGVAKRNMSQKTSDAIEGKVHQLLREKGAVIDNTYICFHHPQAIVSKLKKVCDCRKPKPGLLLKAARELRIDLEKSVFLGDKANDVEAGRRAGCKTIIFIHNEDVEHKVEEAKYAKTDYKIVKISEAIPVIENIFKSA
ncbi:HAD-IIIA family hydrolase [Candidatus Gottesmanbacteria bacterium]|nr:HAD-IIIA family hydrolase [Candidatus Gottesmanbacteria bacterium]